MEFPYFKYPEKYAAMTGADVECDICGSVRPCFDAESFFSEEDIAAICPDCLQSGRLRGREIYTNQGDIAELKQQLTRLHPHLEAEAIEQIVQAKDFELEQATPQLITWQDWGWPCADGDFCQFLQYGSQADLNRLAADGAGKKFFAETLYEDLRAFTEIDDIWDALPEKPIESLEESNYDTVCYIFQSLSTGKIVTIWDCS